MPKKIEKSQATPKTRPGLLTVGQTARILGVSPSTLRVWENVGLVTPTRSEGRYRLYNSELLDVLKRIKYLRDVQRLSVPGIKQMLGREVRRPAKPKSKEDPDVGLKLRKMRKSFGIGIVEAARRAGVSPGFLSAIELSKANPSVATLQRLTAVYNTTIIDFFDLPRESGRLIRPEDRRMLRTESGVEMELLSIGGKMLECMLFRVPPKSGSDGAYSHAGEEFIFMLAGELEIWLDETESHYLRPGDSFWFESNLGHRWFNSSTEEAVLLWVNTPPTF